MVKTEGAARAAGNAAVRAGAGDQLSRADRVARGKDARALAPLESHAEFTPDGSRDPVGLLLEQAKSRVPELVPVRHGRMLVSPFTFYRGRRFAGSSARRWNQRGRSLTASHRLTGRHQTRADELDIQWTPTCGYLDQALKVQPPHNWTMDETSITAAGAIDTFLVLLIGIGPKLALVPFVEITAPLDPATKRRVLRKMLATAATVAVLLMVLGELLRTLLHFSIGSLSIAGGVILLVLAVWMVLSPPDGSSHSTAGKDPMQLALFPLAVPYLLNPVGIVGLITISAEAKSLSVFAVEFGILVVVLLIDVAVFRWANRVSEKLDEGRMLVTEKVFGFLIAAIAVQLVLDGLVQIGVLASVPH